MATSKLFFPLQENVEKNSFTTFKNDVTEKLKWDRTTWTSRGMQNSSLFRLCNLINFGRKQLDDAFQSNTLMITFYNENSEAYVNIEAICEALRRLIQPHHFLGFFRPRNRRIIGLVFDSKETKDHVKNLLTEVNGDRVVDLEWASRSNDIDLRLHWLHPEVSDHKIHMLLIKFMKIKSILKEKYDFTASAKVNSGLISIKAELHPGISMDDVPHLMYLGGLQTLITIKGRVSLCLSCETLGHIAARCTRPYCKNCKMNKPRKHVCSSLDQKVSYAKALTAAQEDARDHDLTDSEQSDMFLDENEEEEISFQSGMPLPPPPAGVLENEHKELNSFKLVETNGKKGSEITTTPPPPPSSLPTTGEEWDTIALTQPPFVAAKRTRNRKKTNLRSSPSLSQHGCLPVATTETNKTTKTKSTSFSKINFIKKNITRNRTYAKTEPIKEKLKSENLFDALKEKDVLIKNDNT